MIASSYHHRKEAESLSQYLKQQDASIFNQRCARTEDVLVGGFKVLSLSMPLTQGYTSQMLLQTREK